MKYPTLHNRRAEDRKSINDATPEEWDSLNYIQQKNKALDEHLEAYEEWARLEKQREEFTEEKASDLQIGGNHYKKFKIQPAEFCYKNNIPYLEATAIKYLCRWKDKGGLQDLEKAKHFIDLLIEFQNANS